MRLSAIRKFILFRPICISLALCMFFQIGFTPFAFALTSGPSQPEVQSFEPAGTTDMVDLFSGDFTYNIPLVELPGPNGGYPFNISYHSGVGMDQEASWVGLGWNLNPGVINRNMRGLPDDFDGDEITKTSHIKKNYTYGVSFGTTFELIGADSDEPAKASLSATLGLRLYYNNYKGVGYNFAPTFGYGPPKDSKMSNMGINAGFSLDSQDGVGANASVDLKSPGEKETDPTNSYSLGVGFNSQRGLSLSATGTTTNKYAPGKSQSISGSSSISFSEQTYSPTVSLPMKSSALDVTAKLGPGVVGAFPSFSVGGFYNEQELLRETSTFKAYGYNNLENAGPSDMLDFNRSKEGIIREETPNLPIPQLTHDVYSVMGQGIGGMYRPYRSDIGHIYDPLTVSTSSGGTFGLDIGPPDHYGGNFTYSSGLSYSGEWQNSWGNYFSFKDESASPVADYEPVYYKSHGEMTSFPTNELDYIGGEQPVRANLTGSGKNFSPQLGRWDNNRSIVASGSVIKSVRATEQNDSYRMPRNMSIIPVTNKELGNNNEVLGEYDITLSSGGSVNRSYDNLIGGITSINAEGMRYVYGLPAYNTEQEEYLYSVAPSTNTCITTVPIPSDLESAKKYKIAETDEFFSKTEMPPYAYAYMLTSILGPDFVDLDGNGPDDGDMGYWVKFNYKRVTSDYEWKAPFDGANYLKGYESSAADNRAAYTRGKKEVYYLESAESSTHKLTFFTSARTDAGDAGSAQKHFHRLDKMELKVKSSEKLLQTVHFTYNYSLCNGIQNGTSGKLTLTQLHFTYGKNQRGSLSPYKFDYGNTNHTGPREANPSYSTLNYDRWGNYKDPASGTDCEKIEFPYVDQFDRDNAQTSGEKDLYQAKMDEYAASWNLTDIALPTGGSIKIDYEADDYAYVQHKRPMQMFRIRNAAGLDSKTSSNWKVYFDLEHPIDNSLSDAEIKAMIKKQYIDGLKVGNEYQLYYRVKMSLRQDYREYVSGYANIDVSSTSRYGVGSETALIDGQTKYTRGYITLKKMNINGTVDYHPFRVAAWQHMRTNQPELLFSPGKLAEAPGSSKAAKANKIKSLVSFWPTIKAMFKGYRKYAFDKGYAGSIDNDLSIIRLTNPDGKKYGGGSRVKRLEISDNWSASTGSSETSSSYGQVYDYTTVEDGEVISTGVAQYEPMIGGNETPFRVAKNYPGHNPIMTQNNLFFEYPINESYFPGASVGYSKVTVSSLATDDVVNHGADDDIATTGVVVHEFYTAKEFPVITDETAMIPKPFNLTIPLPFIGQTVTNALTVTQGYSIILNDMHGKPKSVYYYGLDKYGEVKEVENSYVKYNYSVDAKSMDGKDVWQLDNEVDVIDGMFNGSNAADTEKRIVGVEYEFFNDLRHSHSESNVGGLKGNTDFMFSALLPIPVIVPWPTVISTTNDLKMVVSNKIIHKAGILEETVAFDGEATVSTKNILFDGQTGKPLLTMVNNNYEAPLYKLEYPAHWSYEGMSGAYKNIGVVLTATVDSILQSNQYHISGFEKPNGTAVSDAEAHRVLQEGDELLVLEVNGTELSTPRKATLIEHLYVGSGKYSFLMHAAESYSAGNTVQFKVVRSGRRNQLSTMAGDVLAMGDPTKDIGIENLPQVNLNGAPDDFVDVMNNELLLCDGTLLIEDLIDFDSRIMFDNEGKYKYPQTRKLLKEFRFNYCTSAPPGTGHYCQYCQDLPGDPQGNDEDSEGYHIRDIVKRSSSSASCCCECVAYRRKPDAYTSTPIIEFSPSTPTTSNGLTVPRLNVDYNGRSQSKFCIFPSGSSTTPGSPNHNTCWDPVSYVPQVIYYDSVLNASAVEFSDYWNYDYPTEKCPAPPVEPNMYATGKKGIFRVSKSHFYNDERLQSLAHTNLSHDGMYENVDEPGKELRFYPFRWNADLDWPLHERWRVNQTITQYNKGGFEVENKDALGNYSAAQYGYSNTLPVAVATNSDYYQLYFNSFDDPSQSQALAPSGSASINSSLAHTGLKSCYVASGGGDQALKTTIRTTSGATYYISGWVRANGVDNHSFGTTGAGISINFYNEYWGNQVAALNSISLVGNVVEGWQRFQGKVTAPSNSDRGRMAIVLQAGSADLYYDDIRVVNNLGNVKTYVYHPDTYRLEAVLDENNFASLYSYDEEGKLYLVRKETEKGILTVQESMNHLKE